MIVNIIFPFKLFTPLIGILGLIVAILTYKTLKKNSNSPILNAILGFFAPYAAVVIPGMRAKRKTINQIPYIENAG